MPYEVEFIFISDGRFTMTDSIRELSFEQTEYTEKAHGGARNFLLVERAVLGIDAEMGLLFDMPILNPAVKKECKQITLALVSAFKRASKYLSHDAAFENALAASNEELGKLISLGKGSLSGKLSASIYARFGSKIFMTTSGAAKFWIFRNGKLIDVSSESVLKHPLKTFENFSSGKLMVGDILVTVNQPFLEAISTSKLIQILNGIPDHASAVDALTDYFEDSDISEFLAGFMLLHVRDMSYIAAPVKVKQTTEKDFEPGALKKSFSKIAELKKPNSEVFSTLATDAGKLFKKAISAITPKKKTNPDVRIPRVTAAPIHNVLRKSRQKYVYATLSAVALVAAVGIFMFYSKRAETARAMNFTKMYNEISEHIDATPALLNQSEQLHMASLSGQIKDMKPKTSSEQELVKKLETKLQEKIKTADHSLLLNATSIGPVGESENLVKFTFEIGAQNDDNVINRASKLSGKFLDKTYSYPNRIEASAYLGGSRMLIYDGDGLTTWDFAAESKLAGTSQDVPLPHEYGGFVFNSQNSKAYVLNKKTKSITGYEVQDKAIVHPKDIAANEDELGTGFDLSFDGNFWILSQNYLYRRASTNGEYIKFDLQNMFVKFAGRGKVQTSREHKNVYVLDGGNARILVFSKELKLLRSYTFSGLTTIKDMDVDERAGTIYLLSDEKIFKSNFETEKTPN